MARKKKRREFKSESEMADAVRRFVGGRHAAREVRIKGGIFDVVGYNKKQKLFSVVECKLSRSSRNIGRTFGQVAAYYAVIAAQGSEFLDVAGKRLGLSFRRLMEATDQNRKLRVAFYVGLTHGACRSYELLKGLKKLLPQVGIIRVKPGGKCRSYLLRRDGSVDRKLPKAKPLIIPLLG